MAKEPVNPYAQFLPSPAPEAAPNPYAQFVTAPQAKAAPPAPDTSAAQLAGVVSGAFSPYATAAGMGAMAGAPFAGVGAPFGAAGGVLSLGLADLGTGLYNTATPLFNGERVRLPSEIIRSQLQNVGVGRAPQTPGQEVLFRTAEGAAGALSGASALGTMASRAAPGVARNVMQLMAQAPLAQTAAGAAAGGVPAAAREYGGVTDPLALAALSLGAGGLAGAAATPRPTAVTPQQLIDRARTAYANAEQAGVQFEPTSIANLGTNILTSLSTHPRVQFHPGLHPRVATVLTAIEDSAQNALTSGAQISFSELELLRRLARTAANTPDRDQRRLVGMIINQIDSFVDAPPANAVVSGNAPGAATAIREARQAWRQMSQGDVFDTMVERATQSAGGLNSKSLQAQARAVANNPNRMRGLDRNLQQQVRNLASGRGGLSTLQGLGSFAPSLDAKNVMNYVLGAGTGGAIYTGQPALGALGVGLGATGLASKAAANRMALNRVNAMASEARGTPARQIPFAPLAAAAGQEAVRGSGGISVTLRPDIKDPNKRASMGLPPL